MTEPDAAVAEIEVVLGVLDDARRLVDASLARLREGGAEKLVLESVRYTSDELAAAEKRLVQRTMHLAATRPHALAS